jgi:hypothetical protein
VLDPKNKIKKSSTVLGPSTSARHSVDARLVVSETLTVIKMQFKIIHGPGRRRKQVYDPAMHFTLKTITKHKNWQIRSFKFHDHFIEPEFLYHHLTELQQKH